MIHNIKKLVIYILILSIMVVPAQSMAAMLMDHLSADSTMSQLKHPRMNQLPTGGHHQNHTDNTASIKHKQTQVHPVMVAQNGQTCDERQSVCNQCDNCSHCINLIDCANWQYVGIATPVEILPVGVMPSPEIHLLLRPPIRS